jgi:hypothetical protein
VNSSVRNNLIKNLNRNSYNTFFKSKASRFFKWLSFYYQLLSWLHMSNLLLSSKTNQIFISNEFLKFNLSDLNLMRKDHNFSRYQVASPLATVSELPTVSTFAQSSIVDHSLTHFNWFKDYWILHQSKSNDQYSIHRDFKTLFFICTDNSGVYNIIGISKFYSRWTQGLNLVFNLSYFNANLASFTNKIFLEDSLVINWSLNQLTYKIFKFSQSVVYLKDISYGEDSKLTYKDSELSNLDAAIISDVKSHEKNIFFLRVINIYKIGLIPASYSPWVLTFPIPLLVDSLLGQFYFLNVILRMAGLAKSKKYNNLLSKWNSLKFTLNHYQSLQLNHMNRTTRQLF